MSWFRFGVGCPSCETPLEPVALGRPTDIGTRTANVLRCDPCNTEWLLELGLTPAHREVTPTEKAKPVPARQWVLEALKDGPMTPRQAQRLAGGMWTHNALGTALRELYKDGRASRSKDRYGAYVYEIQEKQEKQA